MSIKTAKIMTIINTTPYPPPSHQLSIKTLEHMFNLYRLSNNSLEDKKQYIDAILTANDFVVYSDKLKQESLDILSPTNAVSIEHMQWVNQNFGPIYDKLSSPKEYGLSGNLAIQQFKREAKHSNRPMKCSL